MEAVELYLDVQNYIDAGITGEEGIKMFLIYRATGGSKKQKDKKTWFGHNWTGPSNNSDFPNYNNKYKKKEAYVKFLFFITMVGIDPNKQVAFLRVFRHLQPKPKSYADSIGKYHDGAVPGSNAPTLNCRDNQKYIKADLGYIERGLGGWFNGNSYQQPLDSLVGIGGSVLFALDLMLFRAGPQSICF